MSPQDPPSTRFSPLPLCHRWQEPICPEGVYAARPMVAVAVSQALFLAIRQFTQQSLCLYQRFVLAIVHLVPTLETASEEILPVLSQNWEKYYRSTCTNEKSYSCIHSRQMQVYFLKSILPSSCAQGFPVKPSKFSSLPHSYCCSKVNPSSVFHIPHQPPLWHWSLAKPGGATVKGRTMSSPPTPQWVLRPLRGAGSKSRVAM